MTLPHSQALAGRPSPIPPAAPPDAWRRAEARAAGGPTVNHAAGAAASPRASDSGPGADSGRRTDPGRSAEPGRRPDPGLRIDQGQRIDQGRRIDPGQGGNPGRSSDPARPHAEQVWEQRRALGRQLASLRSRSGFSQWEFAPLTGYSRSTLSDAELGRHRLRREFWQRCDEALLSDGALTAAYDRIETVAVALRRAARSQAQAAREEQASRRLQALLPASSAEGPGADGGGPFPPMSPSTAPAVAPGGVAPGEVAPGGTAANGIVWGNTGPLAPAPAGPPAPRVAPDSRAPAGSARVAGSGRAGSVPPGPASSGAAAYYPETATQSRREGARPNNGAAQPNSGVAQPNSGVAQWHGEGAQPPLAVMEQCPHCHQPVTVIIVATTPPAAGRSAGS
jgi:Helix-turn-helix domain